MNTVKNYCIFNGCHNCTYMQDASDIDTGNVFICLLQHPEMRDKHYSFSQAGNITVDEFGTCDEWQEVKE